jgi:hypothetical protein
MVEAADHWQRPWPRRQVKLWFREEKRLDELREEDDKHGHRQGEEHLALHGVANKCFRRGQGLCARARHYDAARTLLNLYILVSGQSASRYVYRQNMWLDIFEYLTDKFAT